MIDGDKRDSIDEVIEPENISSDEMVAKETLKNKCFNTVAMPPCDLVYCAA